jgi:hypothetical protein
MKRIFAKLLVLCSVVLLLGFLTIGNSIAAVVTIPLSDFLVFSGGGWVSDADPGNGGDAGFETQIAGASLYIGNIGSNYDLELGASETQVLGSVYAGGEVDLSPRTAIGSDGNASTFQLESPLGSGYPTYPQQWERVVANGYPEPTSRDAATLRDETKIWGTLDAKDWSYSGTPTVGQTVDTLDSAYYTIGSGADTFARISMPGTSFVHSGTFTDQALSGAGEKTIAPGHWGDLTTTGNQTILLSSGDYYFDSINTSGDAVTLKIDLSSGGLVNIYTVNQMNFGGQDNELMVKGPGMTEYVLISDPSVRDLAGLINWETRDTFTLGGGTGNTNFDDSTGWGSIWGGTVYSSLIDGIGITTGQHIDLYGALHAGDTIDLADHSRFTYVPLVPIPGAVWLLGSGLIGLVAIRRRTRK